MDRVTKTSLEALLVRATCSNLDSLDPAAVEAFCALINKEVHGALNGARVIASNLPHANERELMLTLELIDLCMNKCGSRFQNEVGKFRFLNEMIKLVSPKYLGSRTPIPVKEKVLQLLYFWTTDYPKEIKIKEAFDMLKKQGVAQGIPKPVTPMESSLNQQIKGSAFQDKEKSNILKKLLQSKNPEDIQAANWLIKSMVEEDEKLSTIKSKTLSQLESGTTNLKLLNEMLDTYNETLTTSNDLDLINELYENSVKFRPCLQNLVWQAEQCAAPDVLDAVLRTSDDLTETLLKYEQTILKKTTQNNKLALLNSGSTDLKANNDDKCSAKHYPLSTIDILSEVFSTTELLNESEILQPIAVQSNDNTEMKADLEKPNKFKALEDLDVFGGHITKDNLQCSRFQKKIPMNMLSRANERKEFPLSKLQAANDTLNTDLIRLLEKPTNNTHLDRQIKEDNKIVDEQNNSDDCLVDICEEDIHESTSNEEIVDDDTLQDKLNHINICFEDVKPSSVEPVNVYSDKNGTSVNIHLAEDKPDKDVSVYVITTISRSKVPLTNYLFQAVVSKGCALKLQPPSSTSLPAFNPFLPPSAITQIMLIVHPPRTKLCLKFIASYIMDNDLITETGEVNNLPFKQEN